ncbi:hypothetical protein B1R94_02425 [Mycolicibacterium litorale]|nr:hypothetical protein B1R94_02425 [Mycolicibacterium litorale]
MWRRYRQEMAEAKRREAAAQRQASEAEQRVAAARRQRDIVGRRAAESIEKTESLRNQVKLNGFTELLVSTFGRRGHSG